MLLNIISWPKIFIVKRWTQKSVIICHLSVLESLGGSRALASTLQQSTQADLRAKSHQRRLIHFYSSYLRRSTQTKEHFLLCHPGKSWTRFRFLSCELCLYRFYLFPSWKNWEIPKWIALFWILWYFTHIPDTANSLRLRNNHWRTLAFIVFIWVQGM